MAEKKEDIMLQITLNNKTYEVKFNTPIIDVFNKAFSENELKNNIAAMIHNRLFGLTYPLRSNCTVKPVTVFDSFGSGVYRRSASLLLVAAFNRLYPDYNLVVGQSLSDGHFYNIPQLSDGIPKEMIKNIETEMKKLVRENLPFEIKSYHVNEVKKMLLEMNQPEKVNLLRIHWEPQVRIVKCDETFDLFHNPFAPSTSYIHTFKLESYWPGMVLRFPSRKSMKLNNKTIQLPTLFQTYMEARNWNQMLGVENLGELNGVVLEGKVAPIIRVAEGLHEKKIASIADIIASKRPDVKLVLIAGPSSSGKTTFSKRLAVQLQVNGIKPLTLEMDNFFVERDQTPRDEKGDFDFESIDAIDLNLFNEVLIKLMEGKKTLVPVFDFKKGGKLPKEEWIPTKLEEDQVLIVEGIHGLNEKLTQGVLGHRKFKIYISALTQLCIDDHNRIFTSDVRLIRRIVRDRNFRGYNASETIKRWASVRKGEMKHIFPFQERADIMFNSALVYEQGVLKTVCERALLEVEQDDEAFVTAYRLLRFLRLIMPISKQLVPANSIVREFIGQSAFKY